MKEEIQFPNKKYFSISILFIILGIVLTICINVLINITTIPEDDRVYVDAVIKNIEEHYTGEDTDYEVYVEYYINNKKYNEKLDFYSSNMFEGQELKIYYDKNDVKRISSDDGDKISTFFRFMPLLFTLVGLILLISGLIKKKKEEQNKIES